MGRFRKNYLMGKTNMPDINTNLAWEKGVSEKKPGALDRNVTLSILILVIIGCLYGALLLGRKVLSGKISQLQSQYDTEYNNFISGNANEVADFKNRSDATKKLVDGGQSAKDILSQVENSILPSVYLTKYEYEKKGKIISLSCVASDFNVAAKQILSFKENEFFSSVTSKEGSVDPEKRGVTFSVVLNIK
jgi:hypothetical protein